MKILITTLAIITAFNLGFAITYSSKITPAAIVNTTNYTCQFGYQVEVNTNVYNADAFAGLNEAFGHASWDDSTKIIGTNGYNEITLDINTNSTPATITRNNLFLLAELPFKEISGMQLFIYPKVNQTGYTKVRFFVTSGYFSDESVDNWLKNIHEDTELLPLSAYNGLNTNILGTTTATTVNSNDVISIDITQDILAKKANDVYSIWITACFESLDSKDFDLERIGFIGENAFEPYINVWKADD